jgi:hypothetical protein
MEIVECNKDKYKEVKQNHGAFYTFKRKTIETRRHMH